MIPDSEGISAGFLVKDRKVLVAQRDEKKDMPLKWEFPGGKLQDEEQYDTALIREFKEEFDIDIEVLKEIGAAESPHNDKVLVVLFFLIEGDTSKIKLNHHKEFKFVTLNELKNLDICEADKIFITNFEAELKEYID